MSESADPVTPARGLQSPEQPARPASEEEHSAAPRGPQERVLSVRRAPSIPAFIILGLVLGLIVAALSTLFGPVDQAYTPGAIFGLMAALLVVAVKVGGNVQALFALVAVNVVITVLGAGFISWQGHLGGFLGGLVLAIVLVFAPRRHRTAWQLTGMGAVAVLVTLAVVARTLVLT